MATPRQLEAPTDVAVFVVVETGSWLKYPHRPPPLPCRRAQEPNLAEIHYSPTSDDEIALNALQEVFEPFVDSIEPPFDESGIYEAGIIKYVNN